MAIFLKTTPERPNIILILGDYMGYGDLGSTGVQDISTPHLDRLAREGTLFTDATAAAPICSPSRAAILTGRYPARIGLEENINFGHAVAGLPGSEVTLASILRDDGFRTGLFGKWHLGMSHENDPIAHGFENFLGFHDWSIDYHTHRMMNGRPGLYEGRKPTTRSGYSTDVFTDAAIDFINEDDPRPYFAFVSYNAALPPHQPPQNPDDHRNSASWHDGTRSDYKGVVESLDAGVGKVLNTLCKSGVAENTIVVFSYDHGGKELTRRHPFSHGFASLWEGGIRVPLIVRWPGHVHSDRRNAQSLSLMDIMPTLVNMVGAALPSTTLDGIDLHEILCGNEILAERTFCWRLSFYYRRQKAIRQGIWKFLQDDKNELLFALDKDPGESNNLIYEEPEIAAELRIKLRCWDESFPKF
ncbi:MAG: arylsulfatase A-like enzyme [Parasphingorhabdus sp.]